MIVHDDAVRIFFLNNRMQKGQSCIVPHNFEQSYFNVLLFLGNNVEVNFDGNDAACIFIFGLLNYKLPYRPRHRILDRFPF